MRTPSDQAEARHATPRFTSGRVHVAAHPLPGRRPTRTLVRVGAGKDDTSTDAELMTAKKRGRRPSPVKGFRPGKEPLHVKKRRAKARLGNDATWLQKQTLDAVAGRRPEEVRSMVRTWRIGLTVGGLLLALGGFFLYAAAWAAGAAVHLLSAVLLFLAYRLGKHGTGLVEMAETLR